MRAILIYPVDEVLIHHIAGSPVGTPRGLIVLEVIRHLLISLGNAYSLVAPYLAHLLALVPVIEITGGVVVASDGLYVIGEDELHAVSEVCVAVTPADLQVPSLRAHITIIDSRLSGTEDGGLGGSGSDHILRRADEVVKVSLQAIIEEPKVQSDIPRLYRLPRQVRRDKTRHRGGVLPLTVDQPARVLRADRLGEEPGVERINTSVAECTPRSAELQQANIVVKWLKELLLCDIPSEGEGGEGSPTLISDEAR